MKTDEIIAMATEAGLNSYRIAPGEAVAVWERFAALVAAKEREACADLCDRFAARTTEAQQGPSDALSNVMLRQVAVLGFGEAAAAIRARGTKGGV